MFFKKENKKKTFPDGFGVLNIRKSLGKRLILKNVSVNVNFGEIVGLLGPNGAGKTTCFSIMAGILYPDHGSVYFKKKEILIPMYRRARIGITYLPQESSIFQGLNVEKNILAVLQYVEKKQEDQQNTLNFLLEKFSLDHLRHAPSVTLSGGERRRLEIARALALKPQILLLDEPFSGIDPVSINEIRSLILELKNMKMGVLITDHNVRETLTIVDRAYIVAHGDILMKGTPEEITNNKDVRRVYLGETFNL